jgi:acetyl-CoA carboxylase, biotin carboxylase subunit
VSVWQYNKILISNRAEIALRIQTTCKSLGIKTVAIYAPEDANASYVAQADEAYPLSLRGFQAYLNQEEIISIACKAGVDAIHPGYGFLSESPSFAEKVIAADIVWIGPRPETMLLMGDKAQARALMRMINIPINKGCEFKAISFDLQAAKECAQKLGYPVIIKDSLGGGGKAMRRVEQSADFDNAWHAVLSEGKRLGFSGNIIVEKYLLEARHIEVQIAGDGKNVVHLFERECSVQRKHQKIVEEAPCRFVPQETLNLMYDAAVTIAKTVNYRGVGTVEFLVLATGEFYFLEVNARLQVEHSVTEFTTGIDLVALQIHVALNKALPVTQGDIVRIGHAIECRVYAEDPTQNFLPSTGLVQYLKIPWGLFLRVDHDLREGAEVTPFFDPMIAKITVWGATRQQAILSMVASLNDFVLVGCMTNNSLLKAILTDPNFIEGNVSTHWLLNPGILAQLCAKSVAADFEQDEATIVIVAAIQQALEARALVESVSDSGRAAGIQSRWKQATWK